MALPLCSLNDRSVMVSPMIDRNGEPSKSKKNNLTLKRAQMENKVVKHNAIHIVHCDHAINL